MYKKSLPLFFLLLFTSQQFIFAQDTAVQKESKSLLSNDSVSSINYQQNSIGRKPFAKGILVPSLLIGYGIASLEVNGLKHLNENIKEEIWTENIHKPVHLDNYLQYAPGAMVYILNIAGIKGKNNFRDRTIIYAMANIIMGGTVTITKKLTGEWRPDGSDKLSFPSGHTATAFVAAEFLRQEYGDVSVWYSIAGYTMAGATGYLRMYNNKHWLGDVMAAAGVGIISTKLAYWIYPTIKRKLFKNKPVSTMIMPYYQNGGGGLALVYHFSN